jgi:hypothetical protein
MIKNKLLAVSTEDDLNIGDYIQALAAAQYYPVIDGFIQRERLSEYDKEDAKVIMNGWYMHHPEYWPPSKRIDPLFVAFHINVLAQDKLLSDESIRYLKSHVPIGCRDKRSTELLMERGIDAYFSGCMTLTLGKKYRTDYVDEGKVYFVDPVYNYTKRDRIPILLTLLFNFFCVRKMTRTFYNRQKSKLKNYFLAAAFLREYSSVFSKNVIANAEFISHQSPDYKRKYKTDEELLKCAENLVKKYAKADFVVTSRIHCALPCLGLGTSVLYIHDKNQIEACSCRLDGLMDMFTVIYENKGNLETSFKMKHKIGESSDFPANKTDWQSLAKALDEKCLLFMK